MVMGCTAGLAVCVTPREVAGETAERIIAPGEVLAVEGPDNEVVRRTSVVAGLETDELSLMPSPGEPVAGVARADGEVEPG
jgi:hypothetical protein